LSYSNALFEKELKDIEDAMLQLSSPAPDVHMGDPVMTLKKQLVLATITAAFATSQGDMGQTRHLEGQREVPGRLPQGDRSRQGRRRYQGRGRVQDRHGRARQQRLHKLPRAVPPAEGIAVLHLMPKPSPMFGN
jgi:hypothetical protein